MTRYELGNIFGQYEKLRKIGAQLHRLDEAACNYGLTLRQEKRQARLEAAADQCAGWIERGAYCYHQRDPRGCSLYVILPDEWTYWNSHEHPAGRDQINYAYSSIGVGITP